MSNAVIVVVLLVVAAAVAGVIVWRIRGERDKGAGRIHFLTGPRQGEIVEIPCPGVVRIGRGEQNHIVLDLEGVSRDHAEIRTAPGRPAAIWDMQAVNGTMINGEKVSTSQLKSGDIIKIDTVEMRYET